MSKQTGHKKATYVNPVMDNFNVDYSDYKINISRPFPNTMF